MQPFQYQNSVVITILHRIKISDFTANLNTLMHSSSIFNVVFLYYIITLWTCIGHNFHIAKLSFLLGYCEMFLTDVSTHLIVILTPRVINSCLVISRTWTVLTSNSIIHILCVHVFTVVINISLSPTYSYTW